MLIILVLLFANCNINKKYNELNTEGDNTLMTNNVLDNGSSDEITTTNKSDNLSTTNNVDEYDMQVIFENLFGFKLPDTAIILNYDYYIENEEQHFAAKISFDEENLEFIKSKFSGWLGNDGKFLSFYNNDYSWWTLSDINDVIYAYRRFKMGVHVKSILLQSFIEEDSKGEYYLYVKYY